MDKQLVSPPGAPPADSGYSPAVAVAPGRLLFISGQLGRDPSSDAETQMRDIFERLGEILKGAGGDLSNITVLRGYFRDLDRDLPAFRRVRKEYLSEPFPASTVVGVTALADDAYLLEVEAVAVL